MTDYPVDAGFAEMRDALKRMQASCEQLVNENARLNARVTALEAALLKCEWGGEEYQPYCDVCRTFMDIESQRPREERARHKPSCIFLTLPRPEKS